MYVMLKGGDLLWGRELIYIGRILVLGVLRSFLLNEFFIDIVF